MKIETACKPGADRRAIDAARMQAQALLTEDIWKPSPPGHAGGLFAECYSSIDRATMSQQPEKLLYKGHRLSCRLVRGPWGLWEVHFNYAGRDPPMWPRKAVNSRFVLRRTAQAVADAIEEHYRDGCRAGAYHTMSDDLAERCLRDGLISEHELKWWRGT